MKSIFRNVVSHSPSLSSRIALVLGAAALSAVALAACEDATSGEVAIGGAGQVGASGSSGHGGTAGAGTGGASAGGPGGAGGSATAGMSGAGGNAGGAAGGAQGGASQGGSGGAAQVACLNPSAYAGLVTLDAALPFCVVGVHTMSGSLHPFNPPTWGRHGGPTVLDDTNPSQPVLHRWHVPQEPQGSLTDDSRAIAVMDIPPTQPGASGPAVYWGPAVDVPFRNWTLLSYTGASSLQGEAIVVDGDSYATVSRAYANGFFSAVGVQDSTGDRLIHCGLSPLMATPSNQNDSAVYSTKICEHGTSLSSTCAQSTRLASWGQNSGPAAIDTQQTAFIGQSSSHMDAMGQNISVQEVRGFTIGELAANTATGVPMFSDSNYTASMAAVAPASGAPGYLFIEEPASATAPEGPVFVLQYNVSEAVVTTDKVRHPAIQPVVSGARVNLMSDNQGGVWLAVVPDAKASSTTFVALSRLEPKLRKAGAASLSPRPACPLYFEEIRIDHDLAAPAERPRRVKGVLLAESAQQSALLADGSARDYVWSSNHSEWE